MTTTFRVMPVFVIFPNSPLTSDSSEIVSVSSGILNFSLATDQTLDTVGY